MAAVTTIIQTQTVLNDSPVAYWPLDERSGTTASDYSGNGNHLTHYGATVNQSATALASGVKSVLYDGSNDYSAVASDSALNVGDTFTLECWFKRTGTGVKDFLINKGTNGYTLLVWDTDAVYLSKHGVTGICHSTTLIQDTNWHHLVCTKNGGTALMYVDGVECTSTSGDTPQTIENTASDLNIAWDGGTEYAGGNIQQVAIYSTVLTAAQIAAHYAARNAQTLKPLRGSLKIEQLWGARHVCSFTYADAAGTGVHPSLGDIITVADGATTVFAGLVNSITEDGLTPTSQVGLRRTITAHDYSGLCDQKLLTATYASGHTLTQVLTHLIDDAMTVYGLTLDPAQTNPTDPLPELVYVNRSVTDVLNDLASRTGWTWMVSYSKVLGMYAAGTTTSTFTDAQNLSWESSRTNYYNRVYVTYGTQGTADVVDTWTATAAQTVFPLHYTIQGYRAVTEGSTYYPVGVYGVDTMLWTYNAANNSLVRSSGATVGTAISFNIGVAYPQTTYAETATAPLSPWETVIVAPDCTDYASAQALATSLLAQYGASQKRVTFETTTSGLLVGQVLTLTLADRHLSGGHLITSITITHDPNSSTLLRYRVECVSGNYAQGTFLDTYRKWSEQAVTPPSANTTVSGEVGVVGTSTGVSAGNGKWSVDPEGTMVAGSWRFASAPRADLSTSGVTTIFSAVDPSTTTKVTFAWDSTSLVEIGAVGGSTFRIGVGLSLDGSTGKGTGTINTTGGYYENGTKITNYTPSGASGTAVCDAAGAGGTWTFNITDGLITSLTSG